ncbi:alpha/beta hydrolase family esterase [Lysobacter korlensis]|uniref:Alpha/beta hydrolase family esterase n=1 Tax=Lysobacter korlensis TaxID=553636 RepID=A0ABV6RJG8_9GAMM
MKTAFLKKLLDASARRKDATAPHVDGRFDPAALTDTIQRALASAGRAQDAGKMQGVTDTIQRALADAGLYSGPGAAAPDRAEQKVYRTTVEVVDRAESPGASAQPGTFVSRSFSNAAGSRTYKLYVPSGYSDSGSVSMPLVVMLHGCTQSPDDFAAGTRMNSLAERHGFLVAYPAQAANANGSKCWNWFRAEDQQRDRGEPALIAGITREIAANHRVDPSKIFVAGLSAGAAMAVILGETYPDLYAAVGAHSGLAYGAAHDMPSAFGAMKGQSIGGANRRTTPSAGGRRVPTIIFHGDRDQTVDIRNGAAIGEHATRVQAGEPALRADRQRGSAAGGSQYERTIHTDGSGRAVVEEWKLHGAGHAWSGGSPQGSYTDARGPDASAEMVRFFLSQAG